MLVWATVSIDRRRAGRPAGRYISRAMTSRL
jgi:hypothetical protein